jgi:hypothetical protein
MRRDTGLSRRSQRADAAAGAPTTNRAEEALSAMLSITVRSRAEPRVDDLQGRKISETVDRAVHVDFASGEVVMEPEAEFRLHPRHQQIRSAQNTAVREWPCPQ